METVKHWTAEFAYLIGWKTWYHVTYQWPSPGGMMTGDMCISVSPWIRQGETFRKVREYIKESAAETQTGCDVTPNIISITRIGS